MEQERWYSCKEHEVVVNTSLGARGYCTKIYNINVTPPKIHFWFCFPEDKITC